MSLMYQVPQRKYLSFRNHSAETICYLFLQDALGLVLAARSCFDTKVAPLVFKRMHDYALELKNIQIDTNSQHDIKKSNFFLSTHPPSLQRYEDLKAASEIENPEKYSSRCSFTRGMFAKSMSLTR